jgi:hypothetical protein
VHHSTARRNLVRSNRHTRRHMDNRRRTGSSARMSCRNRGRPGRRRSTARRRTYSTCWAEACWAAVIPYHSGPAPPARWRGTPLAAADGSNRGRQRTDRGLLLESAADYLQIPRWLGRGLPSNRRDLIAQIVRESRSAEPQNRSAARPTCLSCSSSAPPPPDSLHSISQIAVSSSVEPIDSLRGRRSSRQPM